MSGQVKARTGVVAGNEGGGWENASKGILVRPVLLVGALFEI